MMPDGPIPLRLALPTSRRREHGSRAVTNRKVVAPAGLRRRAGAIVAPVLAVLALFATFSDAIAKNCRPRRPLPTIVLANFGPCSFDPDTLSFAGDPIQQTECLIRPVGRWAKLGPPLESLPDVLAQRVGRSALLPGRSALADLISLLGLDPTLEAGLFGQLSRAQDGDPFSTTARYFVIHDTSGPKLGWFPPDIDENPRLNSLDRFHCSDSFEIAHAVVNRMGDVFVGHDFGVPWRSTKFERAINFGLALKGLFLHVEMVQPRGIGFGRARNDATAPIPGFTIAQYDRLALLYTLASVRAGEWLIPAFHAVIDAGIHNGHDDPQNFDLDTFAQSLTLLLARLHAPEARAVLN
jgi:hypothetical protein